MVRKTGGARQSHGYPELGKPKVGRGPAVSGRMPDADAFAQSQISGDLGMLLAMGFGDEQARTALAKSAWDVNRALDYLVSQASMPDQEVNLSEQNISNVLDDVPIQLLHDSSATSSKCMLVEFAEETSPRSSNQAELSTSEPTLHSSSNAGTVSSSPRDEELPTAGEVACVPSAVPAPCPEQVCPVDSTTVAAWDVLWAESGKRLMHVATTWQGEPHVSSSLAVRAGDFVAAWPQSCMAHGWVYAEDLSGIGAAGWLPCGVLQHVLPGHEKFMRTSRGAQPTDSNQLYFEAGAFLRINTQSFTKAGWVFGSFVEAQDRRKAGTGQHLTGDDVQTGWIPTACLEWRHD